MGIRRGVSRNTPANANRHRDWRIHAEFAQELIRIARPLYTDEDLEPDLDSSVYAFDSSICACIPAFMHLSEAKPHDVRTLLTPYIFASGHA